jgi:2-phosphoglycolate phosphatase
MTAVRAVLFDVDGTLLDTAPDMVGALNALRAEEGLEPLPFLAARGYVSHGSIALVRIGFDDPPPLRFDVLRRRFLDLYRQRIAAETRLFPGQGELLDALDARGVPWAVVTNKPGWLTEPLLEELNLRHRASCVVSGDTFAERKPHPKPLLHAAAAIGRRPKECVYVGDAQRDAEAARAAGMRVLIVRYGYFGPHENPETWPIDGWIERPQDLLGWIEARGA